MGRWRAPLAPAMLLWNRALILHAGCGLAARLHAMPLARLGSRWRPKLAPMPALRPVCMRQWRRCRPVRRAPSLLIRRLARR